MVKRGRPHVVTAELPPATTPSDVAPDKDDPDDDSPVPKLPRTDDEKQGQNDSHCQSLTKLVAAHLVSAILSTKNISEPTESGQGNFLKGDKSNDLNCCHGDRRLTFSSLLFPIASPCIEGNRKEENNDNPGHRLRHLLDQHGFRTSIVKSPYSTGPSISIYRDSCQLEEFLDSDDDREPQEQRTIRNGKEFLLIAFGLHPKQTRLEEIFRRLFQRHFCLLSFCKRIREIILAYSMKTNNGVAPTHNNMSIQSQMHAAEYERQLQELEMNSFSFIFNAINSEKIFSASSSRLATEVDYQRNVDRLMKATVKVLQNQLRSEVLDREYQKINSSSCTLANVHCTFFMSIQQFCIHDIVWKPVPHARKFERITIHLSSYRHDCHRHEGATSSSLVSFTLIPSLTIALNHGMTALVDTMVESLWEHLLRNGYLAPNHMKEKLHESVQNFFLSGLGIDKNGNVRLNSQFSPTYPFSVYLHGEAGSGKSSFARVFPLALQATLEEHVDPDISVRMVKQNLNKCQRILEVEMELRNNNNDLSVMSIIQGRRQAMRQSKPGLVVVDLEEMPQFFNTDDEQLDGSVRDPNQLDVVKLISHRFGGRKGSYRTTNSCADNSNVKPMTVSPRGIGKDSSLLTIITSNYGLSNEAKSTLQNLEIFENICVIGMSAVSGADREKLALSILRHHVSDNFLSEAETRSINFRVDMLLGDGDVRPIVTSMRSLSYFAGRLIKETLESSTVEVTSIEGIEAIQRGHRCSLSVRFKDSSSKTLSSKIDITLGNLGVWFPSGVDTRQLDCGNEAAIQWLEQKEVQAYNNHTNIQMLLEYWRSRSLAPTVFISQHKESIGLLMGAIRTMMPDVNCIPSVNAQTYKMTKSLYDRNDTANLRDDILKFGRGALVAIEMHCPTIESQLCIREMIEDSPSMTAFSTTKSAMTKSGLLFAIVIDGDITPEILSRASCLL